MVGLSDEHAMARALVLARSGAVRVNPRVGCVVLDARGEVVGEGWHDGVGTPHAEDVALRAAGDRARGGTAVVTLEPCSHRGSRAGSCVEALLSAGVARVTYGRRDTNPIAAGGADALRSAGVVASAVDDPVLAAQCSELVARWAFAVEHGRPFVTWKYASTLDGRVAAADGSSRWITGPRARADVHLRRAECDAILVGTGTVLRDDPQLTVRDVSERLAEQQPLRAVMGLRELPAAAAVFNADARAVRLLTRSPADALRRLWELGTRAVWLEGGPTLAAAFLAAGVVDEIVAYVAPAVLGSGTPVVADLGRSSISEIIRFELVDVSAIGADVRIICRPSRPVAVEAHDTHAG